MSSRPSKEEYYLGIAKEVAKRGTCLRRNFGAVIVKNDQLISTGYVGAPRKSKNCIDIGKCIREEQQIPQGQRYELCRSVHAEMNAIIHASRADMIDSSMFLVGIDVDSKNLVDNSEPCKLCKRVIINAGIKHVFAQTCISSIKKFDVLDWVDQEFESEGY